MPFSGIDAGGGPYPEVEKDQYGHENMDCVEADDRIEHGAIQARSHAQSEAHQPDPFEPLHREEDDAQHARDHQPPRQLRGCVLLHIPVGAVHSVTADEEKHGVHARDAEGQPGLARRRPFGDETRPQPEQNEQ